MALGAVGRGIVDRSRAMKGWVVEKRRAMKAVCIACRPYNLDSRIRNLPVFICPVKAMVTSFVPLS